MKTPSSSAESDEEGKAFLPGVFMASLNIKIHEYSFQ
jgi:hypothetical protein